MHRGALPNENKCNMIKSCNINLIKDIIIHFVPRYGKFRGVPQGSDIGPSHLNGCEILERT